MNKMILEKLLHGYNLIDRDLKKTKFTDHFTAAAHMIQPKEEGPIKPEKMHSYMKALSQGISQSAKFHLPIADEGTDLTLEEKTKLSKELELFMPYDSIYVQYESPVSDVVYNLWAVDSGAQTEPEGSPYEKEGPKSCVQVMLMPFAKVSRKFFMDFNSYSITWHNDGSYTYWLNEENLFRDWIDTSATKEGMYTNQSLNNYMAVCNEILVELNLRLQFPQITETMERPGIEPSLRPSIINPRKFKYSTLTQKPSWEHKVLKVNMYANKENSNRNLSSRTAGTKLHSVRKHLRRLPNGRHTFVKAHFRGSSEVGIITKDYEVAR